MTDGDKPDDEASFEGIVSFSSMPPPPRDVHNAATAVGQLSEELLESLRKGPNAVPVEDSNATRKGTPFVLPEPGAESPAVHSQQTARPPPSGEAAADPVVSLPPPPATPAGLALPVTETATRQPLPPIPPLPVDPPAEETVAPEPAKKRGRLVSIVILVLIALAASAVYGWRHYLRRR